MVTLLLQAPLYLQIQWRSINAAVIIVIVVTQQKCFCFIFILGTICIWLHSWYNYLYSAQQYRTPIQYNCSLNSIISMMALLV